MSGTQPSSGDPGVLGSGTVNGGWAIETRVQGNPSDFHSLAAYLRSTLSARIEELGDETSSRRSSLSVSWQGAGGEAFGERSRRLVSACDGACTSVRSAADEVDTLGDTLRVAQDGLGQLLAAAPGRGLRVDGTLIRLADDTFIDLEGPVGDMAADPEHTASVMAAWQATVEEADGYWRQWYDSVNSAGGVLAGHATDLVGFLSDLITVGATQSLRYLASRVMTGQSQWLREEAQNLRGHARVMEAYIARTGDESTIRTHAAFSNEARATDYAADAAAGVAKDPPLPAGVRAGFGSLGALATGVGIYADVHDGESTAQAVTSQTTGLAAGVLGGALAGGALGSAAGPPGSITGAVVGGGAALVGGTAAAILGDSLVDAVWPGSDTHEQPSVTDQSGGTLLEYAEQATTPTSP